MNYQEKINFLSQELLVEEISAQVTAINLIIADLKYGNIPPHQIAPLGLTPDYLSELQYQFPTKTKEFATINLLINNFRNYLAQKYGIWSLPNINTAALIAETYHLKKGLEVMAGNAQWSAAFSATNVSMLATDNLSWSKTSRTGSNLLHKIIQVDSHDALTKFANNVDFILMSWAPNFGKDDYELLLQYRNLSSKPFLFIVGEPRGATTSTDFWQSARLISLGTKINQRFKSFDFINEKIMKVE